MIDVAAERCVLASVIKYGSDAYIELSDIVKPDSFDDEINGTLWKIIQNAFQKDPNTKFDYGTFRSAAQALDLESFIKDAPINDYLRSLKNVHVEKDNIRKHGVKVLKCKTIRDIQRDVVGRMQENVDSLTGSESIQEIMDSIEKPVLEFSLNFGDHDDSPTILKDIARQCLESYAENPVDIIGVSTGYPILDQLMGSLRRGAVMVFSARPKTGKTTLASNIALHTSSKIGGSGIPTLILDTEMRPEQQIPRMLASLAGLSISDIETGRFAKNEMSKNRAFKAVDQFENYKLYYKSINGYEFEAIVSYIKRWVMRYVGINPETGKTNDCVVILDYLKMMNESGLKNMQEYQKIGFLMQSLTTCAHTLDIPILTMVQENKDGHVSQSDRILWLGAGVALFQEKTPDEISVDPPECGNRKMVTIGGGFRFGPGIPKDDYLCFNFDYKTNRIYEIGLRSQISQQKPKEKDDTDVPLIEEN